MTHALLRSFRAALITAIALPALSACTTGPDFQRPAPIASAHYDPQAEAALAPRLRLGVRAEGDWWARFGSARLDAVMRRAIAGNQDLAAADATIAQADEAIAAARGSLRPQASFGASGGRARSVNGTVVETSNFYAVGPTVGFDFDLFGGNKRRVEQQAARAAVQTHRYDAAYLTMTGAVADEALTLASARAQIDAVQALLADDRRTLALVRAGHRLGGATQIDVSLAETQLAQDETLLPPLAQQRDVARHALAVLAGKGPADWVPPDFDLTEFALPDTLPVSLPSDLAHARPDILAAEAELHAASAGVGVATADLYPHLQLSASLAQAGPGIGTLWSLAGGLTGPIFSGGTLTANRRAAIDGYDATLAGYRQTVIRALGQVADVLQAINHDGDETVAQDRALQSAQANLRLNEVAYRAGEIDLLHVVDAQRAWHHALLGQIQARTAQYLDTVQLAVVLGGNADGAFAHRIASRDAP